MADEIEGFPNDYKEMYKKEHMRGVENRLLIRTIYSSSIGMIWLKDSHGRYIWANNKLIKRLLQKESLDDIVGKTDLELAGQRELDNKTDDTVGEHCFNSDIQVILAGKQMRFKEEFMINGKKLVLDVTKDVVRNMNGDIVGTIGSATDITKEPVYDMVYEL